MDGVGTPIIGRPRPLPSHDTPNPAHNTYTLNYEEPINSCKGPYSYVQDVKLFFTFSLQKLKNTILVEINPITRRTNSWPRILNTGTQKIHT